MTGLSAPHARKVALLPIGCLAASLAMFAAIKWGLHALIAAGPEQRLAAPVVATVLAIAAWPVRNADVGPSVRILVRGIAVALGLYGLAAQVTYPIGVSPAADAMLEALFWLSLAQAVFALGAFVRPSLVVVPVVYTVTIHAVIGDFYAISVTPIDYIAPVELTLLLVSGFLLWSVAAKALPLKPRWRTALETHRSAFFGLLFVAAVGAHFSNYFYSAMAKIDIDGGPFLWLTQNDVAILSVNAWAAHALPISQFQEFATALLQTASRFAIPLNALILVGQLACVVCILKRRLMIAVTLFYDGTHVVIYLLSGILFWKWILLNLTLALAMKRLDVDVERVVPRIVGVASVLFAPCLFLIAQLGWYDTPALVRNYFAAVTRDGRTVEIPSNFFGSVSVAVAQHDLGRIGPDPYPTKTWGATANARIFAEAWEGCRFARPPAAPDPAVPARVERVMRTAHLYAMQHVEDGRFADFNLYPHHIWSNPMELATFSALRPDQIDHYVYVTQASCNKIGPDGVAMPVTSMHQLRIEIAP